MKLYSLLKDIKCRVLGSQNLNISGLYHRDTQVKENGLFFCLRGINVDGKNYISSAINNGAVAIVCENEISGISNITQIIVKNARETMSLIACKFFGNPADKLKIIGVTGTNGKTTISTMLCESINNMGKKCSLIGTNGIVISGEKFETGMTTPDPIVLQKYLSIMVKKKVEYVCMEVSAHAIDLCKVDGIKFQQVIFTNLTSEHLDYFKTMERYYNAKLKIFSRKYTPLGIINFDDEYGELIASSIKIPILTYAIDNKNADIIASDIELGDCYQKFNADNNKWTIPLIGKFNIYNVLSVILSLKNLGFSMKDISLNLSKLSPVDGRNNLYNINERLVVIDYAHTPDGLLNILKTCREISGDRRVIVVFGCGGDRDSSKRAVMGKVASSLADYTFITSDNPRFENKLSIIRDIESGMVNNNYRAIVERSEAIFEAFKFSDKGDIILIAGKGSENYIDENGAKIPYSDKNEIEKYRS